jgi:hypothetical protein
MQKLSVVLEELEGAAGNESHVQEYIQGASHCFTELKAAQRRVCLRRMAHEHQTNERRLRLVQKLQTLQELHYQRDFLQRQVQLCRDYETPHLLQMALSEQQPEPQEPKPTTAAKDQKQENENEHSKVERKEQMIQAFLMGDNHGTSKETNYRDPQCHASIMSKLHEEMDQRTKLEAKLVELETTLSSTRERFQKSRSFLQDTLPVQLKQLEASTQQLQTQFLKHKIPNSSSSSMSLIGSARRARFHKAQQLPAPLYCLFWQFQGYLDCCNDETNKDSEHKDAPFVLNIMGVNDKHDDDSAEEEDGEEEEEGVIADTTNDKATVVLTFPIPSTTSATGHSLKTSKIAIQFSYASTWKVVTASATVLGSHGKPTTKTTAVDPEMILVDLFPNDHGLKSPNAANGFLEARSGKHPQLVGRPYHWCNFIAGLQFSSLECKLLEPSTKAVVQRLTRRIQSHTTLMDFLQILQHKPHPMPLHPNFRSDDESTSTTTAAKLVGWTPVVVNNDIPGTTDETTRSFLALIQTPQQHLLRATVSIDVANYPDMPPLWTLQKSTNANWGQEHGSSTSLLESSTPLFDATLGRLETLVNVDYQDLLGEEDDYDDYSSVRDWLLVHQLREITEVWGHHEASSGERRHRHWGRDRRIMDIDN